MEWNKQQVKGLLLVVCAGIAFYCILQNLGSVALAVGQILSMLSPFYWAVPWPLFSMSPCGPLSGVSFGGRPEKSAVPCPSC